MVKCEVIDVRVWEGLFLDYLGSASKAKSTY